MKLNRIFIYKHKYECNGQWYEFVTYDSIVINMFKSGLCCCTIYTNPSYYYDPSYFTDYNSFMTRSTTDLFITIECNRMIREHDMKSAILNYNHENSIITNVSRFIICCRGEYEVC